MSEYFVIAQQDLNLIHDFSPPVVVKCEQYDGDGSKLMKFRMFYGLDEYTIPSGTIVTISGTKKDNTGFNYECTFLGSVVTAPLLRQMTVFNGLVPCNITLIDGEGDQLGSAVFFLDVEKAALQTITLESSNDFQTFKSLIDNAKYYEELAKSYSVGNVGIRDGEDLDNSKYYMRLSKS